MWVLITKNWYFIVVQNLYYRTTLDFKRNLFNKLHLIKGYRYLLEFHTTF